MPIYDSTQSYTKTRYQAINRIHQEALGLAVSIWDSSRILLRPEIINSPQSGAEYTYRMGGQYR